jgi:hypothetical protein
MTSYYCPKCKAEFGLNVDCGCPRPPKFHPEALDASLRIANHFTMFGKIPSDLGMAEIISACYGPTLIKSQTLRDHLVAQCLRLADANTLLKSENEALQLRCAEQEHQS